MPFVSLLVCLLIAPTMYAKIDNTSFTHAYLKRYFNRYLQQIPPFPRPKQQRKIVFNDVYTMIGAFGRDVIVGQCECRIKFLKEYYNRMQINIETKFSPPQNMLQKSMHSASCTDRRVVCLFVCAVPHTL
jgi:hypothetical protein